MRIYVCVCLQNCAIHTHDVARSDRFVLWANSKLTKNLYVTYCKSYGNCQNQIIKTSARDGTNLLQIDCVPYCSCKIFSLVVEGNENFSFLFYLHISSKHCNYFDCLEICTSWKWIKGDWISILPNSSLMYSIIYRWNTQLISGKMHFFYYPQNVHDFETMFKLLLK